MKSEPASTVSCTRSNAPFNRASWWPWNGRGAFVISAIENRSTASCWSLANFLDPDAVPAQAIERGGQPRRSDECLRDQPALRQR